MFHEFGRVLGRPLDTFFWALTGHGSWLVCEAAVRARDHRTSSSLIARKGGAGPRSLLTMFERPTK